MTNFEAVQKCLSDLGNIETRLKGVRDNCDVDAKEAINNALRFITALYQPLHKIDHALDKEDTGKIEL